MVDNGNICKAHSGIHERLKDVEDDVKSLWEKYDSIQKIMILCLLGIIGNLGTVVFMLITK